MNKFTIAALGAACLLSVPALAQSAAPGKSGSSGGSEANGAGADKAALSTAPATGPSTTVGAMPAQASTAAGPMQVRQKITQDLEKDGFTNIHVAPTAFLVHATNREGDPVVMIINPNSVFSMTAVPGEGGNGASAMSEKHTTATQ